MAGTATGHYFKMRSTWPSLQAQITADERAVNGIYASASGIIT
jgi:hypothetical protein